MDGSKAADTTIDLGRVPPIEARPVATEPTGLLSPWWAWFAALVGPVVAALCVAVEPAPADPAAPATALDSLLGLALLSTWALAATTAYSRHPRALTWAGLGGLVALGLSLGCPLSGHHTGIGAWWLIQLTVSGAGLAAAAVGRSRHRRAG